jgi:DNA uptake protein ComE-like DNA-binding protein
MQTRPILIALTLAAAALLAPLAPTPQTATGAQHVIPPPEARVDINHASVDELMKVPGMTSTWAGRIVRFRPYRSKQDLLDHGVLTSQVYDRIKDYVIAHRDKQ